MALNFTLNKLQFSAPLLLLPQPSLTWSTELAFQVKFAFPTCLLFISLKYLDFENLSKWLLYNWYVIQYIVLGTKFCESNYTCESEYDSN
jgi:hypothetical protein